MRCVFPSLNRGTPCGNGCGYKLELDYQRHPIRTCRPETRPTLDELKAAATGEPCCEPPPGVEQEEFLKRQRRKH